MDSADDDFGELYVDVKVQASAFVASGVGFVKSFRESEPVAISDENRGVEGTVKPESQGEMKKFGVMAKDSSPCDDACAVNPTEANEESEYSDSDDDLNIVLKDDDSKALPVARGSNTNNSEYAVADSVETAKTCSFQKRWTRKWSTTPNGGMVNGRISMDASANNVWIDPSLGMPQCGYSFSHPWSRTSFDVFEKKPWRNPGTEVNDFFNYGFNEQSWKDYCKPLGRAIEVGGGTLERVPSAELRRQRDSDPDVVIEIPVTNDVEELSSKEPVEGRSPSITSNEASRSEDLHSDNVNDLSSHDDSIKEEAFVGCRDENTGSSSGEQSPSKENCCSREVTPCDKEIVDEENEGTWWNSDEVDPSSVEREPSLEDRIQFSPTSSYSAGRNEDSEDSETESSKGGAIDDRHESSTPPRRTRSGEHEAISIRSGERNGTKHSRHRRSREDPSTSHCGRDDVGVHRRIKHRAVKDASPTPDPDFGKKVCSQHGSLYRDSSKNWQNGPPPHSDREKRHGRLYPSVDHDRDRDHRFGWRNKESSQGRGFDNSNGYKYEARFKEYPSRSSLNLRQRDSRSSFKEKEDRYGRQHCEREYGRERSSDLAYEGNKERNQYDWRRESYYQDRIPITDMDYRYRSEYSSADGRHNPKQSHENDLHCRRRDDYDYNFPRHRYEDGVHRAESGIPFELAYRERHSFADVGRREFQGYERNQEFSEIDKRHPYTSDWHRDRFVSEKDDYKYRIQDAWPSPSFSLRDSWYAKEARGDSWRDDTRDFITAEAYDSHNYHLYKDAPRDGWTRNLVHRDHVSIQDRLTYEDDWVRRDRGRYQLADDIQCSMREVTHSEHPSYSDETLVRDIRMPTHNRMSTKQRYGYFKSHIHEIDERHHGSKKLKRDGHAFIKFQDPVELTGRHGKGNKNLQGSQMCKLSKQPKRRFPNGEDTKEEQDHQKPRKVICRNNEKAVWVRDLNDKEEGEIVEEGKNVKGIEIDEERIQESLKKMEKRRARFQKTECAKTLVGTFESQTEPGVKIDDTNQQRPVRKRRWCAS